MDDDTYAEEISCAAVEAPSRELVVSRVQVASAYVTPFADAVAAELESFGLTKTKIDEIMMKSAHRFGAQTRAAFEADAESAASEESPQEGYFDWIARLAGQAFENVKSVISPPASVVFEHVGPLVQNALRDALADVMREMMSGKRRRRRRAV